MSLLHASVRYPWLKALCAIAEGSATQRYLRGDLCWDLLWDARLAVMGGRQDQPRSLGSALACFVTLFLGSSFRNVSAAPVELHELDSAPRLTETEAQLRASHLHNADGTTTLNAFRVGHLEHEPQTWAQTLIHGRISGRKAWVRTIAVPDDFWLGLISTAPDGVVYLIWGNGDGSGVAMLAPESDALTCWDTVISPVSHFLSAGADAVALNHHFYSRDGRKQLAPLPKWTFSVAYAPRSDVFAVLVSEEVDTDRLFLGTAPWRSVLVYAPGNVMSVSHEVELPFGSWRTIAFCYDEQEFVASLGGTLAVICRTDALSLRFVKLPHAASVTVTLSDATVLVAAPEASFSVLL